MGGSLPSVLDVASVLLFWLIVWYRRLQEPWRPPPTVSPARKSPATALPLVSIIVPARNEASRIAQCLRSLLAQDYPHVEIIVVDDCSEDETGAIADEFASQDSRLTVLRGTPLPEGWMGKAHALSQGYRHSKGEWLLFTDADTEHAPHLLSAVMVFILESPAAFATVLAQQRHPSPGVYLANLAVFTYIFLFSRPKEFTDPASRQSLVNGQYLLFWRPAYEAIGTHEAVRRYSSTDVSLGYLAKLDGWLPLAIDGRSALQTTMYATFTEAFAGWSRSLVNGIWTALGPPAGSLALVLVTITLWLFWIEPWLSLFQAWQGSSPSLIVVASLQLLAGMTLVRLRRTHWMRTVLDTLLMPIAFLLFTLMAGVGLVRAWLYRGTSWKGRVVRTIQRLPAWNPKPTRNRQTVKPEGQVFTLPVERENR